MIGDQWVYPGERGLAGRRIVNTRAAHQAESLDNLLRDRGAIPVSYPCIAIAPPADVAPLDRALADCRDARYEWLILTSVNTVRALADRLNENHSSLQACRLHCAAVGPATAQAARSELGLEVVDVPEEYSGEAMGQAIQLQPGDRIFLPESAIARPALARILRERGAQVTVVAAYETVCADGVGEPVPALIAQGRVDAVTFTSSSTVECFGKRYEREGGDWGLLGRLCLACIGEKTAETARVCLAGTPVVASEATIEGLAKVLEKYFS